MTSSPADPSRRPLCSIPGDRTAPKWSPSSHVPSREGRSLPVGPILAVLVATAASPLLHGYAIGFQNHFIQLPYLRWLQDPTLFPGDPLIAAMASYFSFFWLALAWICSRLPMEEVFLAGHLLTVALKYAGIFALGRALFPSDRRAAYLGMWLVFFGHSGVGYEAMNWIYFAHTPLAADIGIWALVLALNGRYRLSFLLAGLVFNLHAMQSCYLALMIGCSLLREVRHRVPDLIAGAALFLLGASPGIYWMMSASALEAPADLIDLTRAFFPYHFFPSSFRVRQWIAVGFLLALFAFTRHFAPRRAAFERAWTMCAAIIGLWFVGGAIMETAPNGFFLKLHVFRSSSYLATLLYIMVGGLVLQAWDARRASWPWPVAAGCLLAVSLLGSEEFFPTGGAQRIFMLGALLAFLAALAAAMAVRPEARRAAGAACLLAACLLWIPVGRARLGQNSLREHQNRPLVDAARWAHENTSPSDRFLVPPYLSGFRLHSERAVVGECQDGSGILWSADYADYWRQWYLRMGGTFGQHVEPLWDRLARSWFEKKQQEIEQIAADYGAGYIVLRRPRGREARRGWNIEWDGEPVFDQGVYVIYATPRSAGPPH
jgi:hypothetical protein